MLAFAHGHIPARHFNMSGIKRLCQKLLHTLVGNIAAALARELRIVFKEALDLDLGAEAFACEPFQGLCDDGGERLIADQHIAASTLALVAIAGGCLKHPIAVERPRTHPVFGLLAILLALVLRNRSEKILDQ
ncbi:hypothetical protein WG75_00095 [Citromicrobium sp. WPS32]|nr:hypothetical protein [Citromicrobium sp. WPS32]KPM17713.1 hypothetical protein WG75_00095 [Citromicrobium sp. WPS32]